MRRVQFIELHEQSWLPESVRDEITDVLQFGLNLLGVYSPVAPLLEKALDLSPSRFVIDLCSGGGGPWLSLSRKLQVHMPPFSDLPNRQVSESPGIRKRWSDFRKYYFLSRTA